MTRPAIVLDCDPGLDDAVALLVAARYAELVGVTTVCGNSTVENTTRNALAVLEIAGIDADVHQGASAPLVAPLHDAAHIHGEFGLGPTRVTTTREPRGDDASGYLVELTRRRDDVHLVAVGPLTNVALAVRRDPSFAHRLASLTIMGGGAGTGNVTAAAEFNIWADPEAAAVVFDAGVTVRTVPLNLTNAVRIDRGHIAQLRAADSKTSSFVADLLEFYSARQRASGSERGGAVHDPCAVLAVTHAALFDMHERRVDIELTGTHTRGMTVVDERDATPPRPRNASIAYRARSAEVLSLVVDAAIDPAPASRQVS
jgi:inosine-uridine nucleoside N-ribohydrolase